MASTVNILRVAALGTVCLLGTVSARAQGAARAGTSSTAKIGVIDLRQAIVSSTEGKQLNAEMESQFASRQNDLETLDKRINDLRQRLAAGQTVSDEDRNRLTQQGQRLAAQYERKSKELIEDLQSAQDEAMDRIGHKMVAVVDRYAREKGFTAVFDSSAGHSSVIYKSNSVDLTQDVIRLYDREYPAKASALSIKPALTIAKSKSAPLAVK